jgi:hypothetical protein
MPTIYKYNLQPGRTVLDLPAGALPLTAQMQNGDVCMWVLLDPARPHERRFFDVYGTGHGMPADPGRYVATFQMDGGVFVWHVFEAYAAP